MHLGSHTHSFVDSLGNPVVCLYSDSHFRGVFPHKPHLPATPQGNSRPKNERRRSAGCHEHLFQGIPVVACPGSACGFPRGIHHYETLDGRLCKTDLDGCLAVCADFPDGVCGYCIFHCINGVESGKSESCGSGKSGIIVFCSNANTGFWRNRQIVVILPDNLF